MHYEVDVICPQCIPKAEIKVARSRENPGRLFYKHIACASFIKWATPEEGEVSSEKGILMEWHEGNVIMIMQQEVREIKLIVRGINGRLMFVSIGWLSILVIIAMKSV